MLTATNEIQQGRYMGCSVEQQQLVNALFTCQRDIAVIQTELKNITHRFDKQEETLEDIKKILAEAQGGWRVFMLVGGFAATLGGFVAWLLSNVTVK
jgi:prefoldin subunit 5